MEVSGGWGALRGYKVLRTFRRALECAHGCCREVGVTLICLLRASGCVSTLLSGLMEGAIKPHLCRREPRNEKPTPQKSHGMACAKLGCMGGWKGLALLLILTGESMLWLFVLSKLVQGKTFSLFFPMPVFN